MKDALCKASTAILPISYFGIKDHHCSHQRGWVRIKEKTGTMKIAPRHKPDQRSRHRKWGARGSFNYWPHPPSHVVKTKGKKFWRPLGFVLLWLLFPQSVPVPYKLLCFLFLFISFFSSQIGLLDSRTPPLWREEEREGGVRGAGVEMLYGNRLEQLEQGCSRQRPGSCCGKELLPTWGYSLFAALPGGENFTLT